MHFPTDSIINLSLTEWIYPLSSLLLVFVVQTIKDDEVDHVASGS